MRDGAPLGVAICVSLDFDFRMTAPEGEQPTSTCQLVGELAGSDTSIGLSSVFAVHQRTLTLTVHHARRDRRLP